jgi:hypothetical protein
MIIYILGLLVVALQTAAISTKEWSERTQTGIGSSQTKITIGLWDTCNNDTCMKIPFSNSSLNKNFPTVELWICRVFAILGVILVLIAMFAMFRTNSKMYKWAPRLLIAGGICSMIATIVWSVKFIHVKGPDGSVVKFNPGYSLIINSAAAMIAIGGGIYMLVK